MGLPFLKNSGSITASGNEFSGEIPKKKHGEKSFIGLCKLLSLVTSFKCNNNELMQQTYYKNPTAYQQIVYGLCARGQVRSYCAIDREERTRNMDLGGGLKVLFGGKERVRMIYDTRKLG